MAHLSEQGEELGKVILKDILLRQADRMLLENRIGKRLRLLNCVRTTCPLSGSIEDKEKFVDSRIEKDIKWFQTTRQQKTQN